LHETNASHKATIDDLCRDVRQQQAEVRAELMATIEEERQTATNRIRELWEETEKASEQQQELIDRTLLVYQQHVDETLTNLELQITSETSQRQEQLAKLSERIEGTAQQFDQFFNATNQHQESLTRQLEQTIYLANQLEHIVSEQGSRLARLETLEHIVTEQGKQLARYEPLLRLPGQIESLERGLLRAEMLPDQET
jgi:ABC-type transporter Mla subunit MlaD